MPRKFDKTEWQLIRHSARWMPSDYEVQRGQFGNCLEWALAHQAAYPELRIGMHWFGDGNYTEPNHFFTHDGKYAYDTNGVHELPYDSPDPTIDDHGFESGTEYDLTPEDAVQYQKPAEGRTPSREWILRYAPDPNRPPDVSTPNNEYIEDAPELWNERRPWNNEEPNGWSPMSQHVNEDRKQSNLESWDLALENELFNKFSEIQPGDNVTMVWADKAIEEGFVEPENIWGEAVHVDPVDGKILVRWADGTSNLHDPSNLVKRQNRA